MDPVSIVTALSSVPGVGPLLAYLPVIWMCCALIDAVFPQPLAGSIWVGPRQAVAFFAINFGHATNAVPAGLPKHMLQAVEAASTVTCAIPVIMAAESAAKTVEGSK